MKKVSLRDLTLEQYIEWKDKQCGRYCDTCLFKKVICSSETNNCWIFNKEFYSDKFLDQELRIEEELLLNEEEKDFIKNFIKEYIKARRDNYRNYSVQLIKRRGLRLLWVYKKYETVYLRNPIVEYYETKEYFISASIDKFNQLEMGRDYTMEELGIEMEENNEN